MALTVGAAAAGAAVGGTLLGTAGTALIAGGKLFAGYKQMQAAKYSAAVDKYNASLAEANADRAVERAQDNQLALDNTTSAQVGEQLAIQGASGLSVGSRTSVLTRRSAKALGRTSALNIREAGDIESYNSRVEAVNLRAQAKATKRAGKAAFISSIIDAGSTLIGGATPAKRMSMFTPRSAPSFVRTN